MLSDAPIHATLPCQDFARAKAWYAEKLGLTPADENPGGAFYDQGEGTRFFLFPSSGRASGAATQMGIRVADIEATMADLRSRGVAFEAYDFPGFDASTGIATNGPVRSAWFKDSEGNLIGLVQLPE